jgi:hypothetical protein
MNTDLDIVEVPLSPNASDSEDSHIERFKERRTGHKALANNRKNATLEEVKGDKRLKKPKGQTKEKLLKNLEKARQVLKERREAEKAYVAERKKIGMDSMSDSDEAWVGSDNDDEPRYSEEEDSEDEERPKKGKTKVGKSKKAQKAQKVKQVSDKVKRINEIEKKLNILVQRTSVLKKRKPIKTTTVMINPTPVPAKKEEDIKEAKIEAKKILDFFS